MDRDLVTSVARGLFPSLPPTDWDHIPLVVEKLPVLDDSNDEVHLVPTITTEEIGHARLPSGKAPGPDSVPNEMIRLAFRRYPGEFRECYNACLTNGVFPSSWKRAKLVLLYKGQSKPRDLPSSYRPISLLDGLGKVFERVLLNRLESHISRVGAFSDTQYGFRRSKSTTDATDRGCS